ncbi:thioredoxin family protein [Fervidibacillus halotolerans]|uniref:Thioredoxin family protein n=1 Tax=Fervidibacillus halotolerans TaxID=2980027 RepID=A0A9E8RY68_9BACI|nr:thioredoxin family protein [Fervidibacillus halotolerans]WAA11913.1 thioredoxin family protein [Fervidibacillus halotolerans]
MNQWSKEDFLKRLESGKSGALYLYTPLCGTCKIAEKMVRVLHDLFPDLPMGASDVNYLPDLAESFQIESVPCLVLFKNQKVVEKIYAFHSVPFLYEKVKML